MRVVVAIDSLKGSATARQAADALASGWKSVSAGTSIDTLPMADGGEGTIDALSGAPDSVLHDVVVTGPDGRSVQAQWLELVTPHRIGVIELAQSSGITLMSALAPLDAHTRGLGEVIASALDAGIDQLLIAIGGSASTDGGSGVLEALGARLLDENGGRIEPGGRGLARLATIDPSGLRRAPSGGVTVLSDVSNPLVGPQGAAAIYGPQKGATESDVLDLDHALRRFAEVASRDLAGWGGHGLIPIDAPGAGAAGGTAFGLALWGGQLSPGSSTIADAMGLDEVLAGADLVVTGEGRFDSQTAHGKVVSEVLQRARVARVPCALVAGSIEAPTDDFAYAVSLADIAGGASRSMSDPLRWLRAAGAELARHVLAASSTNGRQR